MHIYNTNKNIRLKNPILCLLLVKINHYIFMNKSSLVRAIAEQNGTTIIATTQFLETLQSVIQNALVSEDDVRIPGFLIFTAKNAPATTGRNPKDGTPIAIPAKRKVFVKCGKALKEHVNETK
jgi:nucleoid DNA-binding protein